jgi:hypothetical protein
MDDGRTCNLQGKENPNAFAPPQISLQMLIIIGRGVRAMLKSTAIRCK